MKAASEKLNVSLAAGHQEVGKELLEIFVSDARKAIDVRGRFCTAISRYTPKILFELLGSDFRSKSLPWNKIHLFNVDECCGPSDLDNNYILMTNTLAQKVGMPLENVHRICSRCRSCAHTASIYEQTIYNVAARNHNKVPQFDMILLQMATDGHIASLFPDTYAFFESERLTQVTHFMDARHTRITLTHPVLHAASHIIVLVSGGEKAEILREIFTHESDIAQYPVHALWPVLDKVTWLVDRDAAGLLPLPYRIETNWRNIALTRPIRMIRWIFPSRPRRVVVDIDTQRCFFADNGKVRIRDNRAVLANIRRVMAWTRLKRINVISTIQVPANNACRCNLCAGNANGLEKIGCTLRTRRTQFDATDCTDLPIEILEQYDQVIFCKRCVDPFEEPRADRMLTELKADEFILIGSLIEGAIKATALGLLARRKNVRVLVDAACSNNKRAARLALRHIRAKGAKLTDTQTLLASPALHLAKGR
ncbi:MAG: 6-phosphogluconolactonase [Planctomycetota bacterium]|jgi:6-phosphogluconolactonase